MADANLERRLDTLEDVESGKRKVSVQSIVATGALAIIAVLIHTRNEASAQKRAIIQILEEILRK